MDLSEIVKKIRNYKGLTRKEPIGEIFNLLVRDSLPTPAFGDDAAVIPWQDGYLLFAADGIMPSLILNEPYAAGKASVMVTVNDIYSMGGRPIAMVNVLASGDPYQRKEIVRGIKKGCEKLKVPMVGGHLHPDTDKNSPFLAVAIMGWAKKVIHGYGALPGDQIVFATDLKGEKGCHTVVSWDANSHKSPQELIRRLNVLPLIAEHSLAHAAKDVSNAGLLGTISIMMENSGKGAIIDMELIPRPEVIDLPTWLICFQSYGFVFSIPPSHEKEITRLFEEREITARVIGEVIDEPLVLLKWQNEKKILFDFRKDKITGISP